MLKTKITVHGIKGFTKLRILILFSCLFIAVPLAYSLYTGHMWEDFFITFKYSKNLCEGNGLVYEKGEKVHGFTSPAGTLLPAFCYLVTGADSFEKAIWLFRILFCIPAFAAAGVFVLSVFLKDNTIHKLTPAVFAGLLFIAEAKSVMFSVNGMETALMLFFLSWSFYLMSREKINWLQNGTPENFYRLNPEVFRHNRNYLPAMVLMGMALLRFASTEHCHCQGGSDRFRRAFWGG
jgi:hypothetical protein